MLDLLIQTAGLWFLAACAAEALAVFTEQAGAARSPEEESIRRGLAALAVFAITTLTPGLLLLHGFFSTQGAETMLRVWAIGAPIAAMLGGAILGAVFGAIIPGLGAALRKVSLPLGIAALVLSIGAALPTLRTLLEALQNGGVIVTP